MFIFSTFVYKPLGCCNLLLYVLCKSSKCFVHWLKWEDCSQLCHNDDEVGGIHPAKALQGTKGNFQKAVDMNLLHNFKNNDTMIYNLFSPLSNIESNEIVLEYYSITT